MTEKKRRRQETLVMAVRKEPFLTDEALAKKLAVSVQTVRLDRTELGIPELRARVRTLAENAREKVRAIPHTEVIGDLLSLELGVGAHRHSGSRTISSLRTRRSRAVQHSSRRQIRLLLQSSMRLSR